MEIRSKENYWFCSSLTNRKQYVSIKCFFSQKQNKQTNKKRKMWWLHKRP